MLLGQWIEPDLIWTWVLVRIVTQLLYGSGQIWEFVHGLEGGGEIRNLNKEYRIGGVGVLVTKQNDETKEMISLFWYFM